MAGNNHNHLIIIDDEPGFCAFVERVARQCGFEPLATDDAEVFRDYVRAHQPSVIILDLIMPKVDGVELLRDLVSLGTQAQVLIASGSDSKILGTALRLGSERGLAMAGTIQKPIRAAALKAILDSLRPAHEPITADRLRAAIHGEELTLHYQPRLDLRANRIVGAEALARWPRPKGGLIPPAEFIPVAEESGLIDDLTEWAFTAALTQCQLWRRQGLALGVSVNLSARSVRNLGLPDWLLRLCQSRDVPPSQITVELTETASMQDAALTMDVLTRFRLKGFDLSIDDFGTGYSSLAQLQRLPFSEMKVDKSFVMTMGESKDSAVIVKTIIDMAHNLGLKAVAEGVENESTRRQLADWGCDFAQGFGIGRPIAAEAIPPFIAAWNDKPAGPFAASLGSCASS